MDIKIKRIFLLLLFMVFLLSGCRTRTTENGLDNTALNENTNEIQPIGIFGSSPTDDKMEQNDESNIPENEKNSNQTKENPEESRKEYDENAPAEIVAGTEHLLHSKGEGTGASAVNDEAESGVFLLNDQAADTATQTVAAEEAEQMGVSQDAEAAESALTYFTVLIQDRMRSVYECQRANVYWETAEDHVTIHKTSPEHALILESGAYDVSSRLLPENLRVDNGWVARKNPQVIVKVVGKSVLGHSAGTSNAAKTVYQRLVSRDGWAAVDAVKSRRVLLLSEELLDAPYLQTAAMLMIAKTANPSLFEDVDIQEALQMLTEEAVDQLPTSVYFYSGKE